MRRRWISDCSAVLTLALASTVSPSARGYEGPTVEDAGPCQWPTAVYLQIEGLGGCSAALIHPQVVIGWGWCLNHDELPTVVLGEAASAPALSVPTLGCVMGEEIGYCVLAQPILDVAIAPPLTGCEWDWLEVGTKVIGAGFRSEGPYIKRFVPGVMDLLTPIYRAEFEPSTPGAGPVFVQLPDGSWRTIGIMVGGGTHPTIESADEWLAWIEADSGIDISPCTSAEGNWEAGPGCVGFATTPDQGGTWQQPSCGDPGSPPSSACGPSLEFPEETNPPDVSITTPPDGALIPGPTAEVDVSIVADDNDGYGIIAVGLFVDGSLAKTWKSPNPLEAPELWTFEDMPFETGEYTLMAVAEDWWGNVAESEPVTFIVGTPPDEPDEPDETDDETPSEESTDEGLALEPTASGCACTASERGPSGGGPLLALLAGLPLLRRRRGRGARQASLSGFVAALLVVGACRGGSNDDAAAATEGETTVASESTEADATESPGESETQTETETETDTSDDDETETETGEFPDGVVDILVVIDNSPAAEDEIQTRLRDVTLDLLNDLRNFVAPDQHVMVVDTDTHRCGHYCENFPEGGCFGVMCVDQVFPGCDHAMGAGRTQDGWENDCGLLPNLRYLQGGEADPVSSFECLANRGNEGDLNPRPMAATIAALTTELAPGGCNEGFLRDEAVLVIIFANNREDSQSQGDPSTWMQQVVAAKGGDESRIVVLGLVPDSDLDGACVAEEPAPLLRAFAESFANGAWGSICALDYQPFFDDLFVRIEAAVG
jgi:MYXO-CTERM domain-containing protein